MKVVSDSWGLVLNLARMHLSGLSQVKVSARFANWRDQVERSAPSTSSYGSSSSSSGVEPKKILMMGERPNDVGLFSACLQDGRHTSKYQRGEVHMRGGLLGAAWT